MLVGYEPVASGREFSGGASRIYLPRVRYRRLCTRSPIGNPLPESVRVVIGLPAKLRQRGPSVGQAVRSKRSVCSGPSVPVPGPGWPGQFLRTAGRVAGQLFLVAGFAALYCRDKCWSSVPSSLLTTALLQVHDRVSDTEAHRRATVGQSWKAALGMEVEERLLRRVRCSISGRNWCWTRGPFGDAGR